MSDTTGIDYGLLPEGLRGGMRLYIEDRTLPGSFLEAVLRNDLMGAFGCADDINRHRMFEIVGFLYNEIPSPAWGSREAVKSWLAGGED